MTNPKPLPHLFPPAEPRRVDYTRPGGGGGSGECPPRDPQQHGQRLLKQLSEAQAKMAVRDSGRQSLGLATARGVALTLTSEPGFHIEVNDLVNRPGVTMLSAVSDKDHDSVTVEVTREHLPEFRRILEDYANTRRETGEPAYRRLVANIQHIRVAVLESLWTDHRDLLPASTDTAFWEVWLAEDAPDSRVATAFRAEANLCGLRVVDRPTHFPDRSVVIVHGTLTQLSECVELGTRIAELRKAWPLSSEFLDMPQREQREWVNNLLTRLEEHDRSDLGICLLDAGIMPRHPLVEPFVIASDVMTLEPDWGTSDDHTPEQWGGHGTAMAGLCVWGDLSRRLVEQGAISIMHQLESVKILPKQGTNDPKAYGYLTAEAVARAEVNQPERRRIVCMAVSESENRATTGRPSTWSAAIDQVAFGVGEGDTRRRLFVLSAGNGRDTARNGYPDAISTEPVHSPAQAWNALTVGAFTEKAHIQEQMFRDWAPLAPPGMLSPRTTTSVGWTSWPIKPDIVMEGGNYARLPGGEVDCPDGLCVLTADRAGLAGHKLMRAFGDTSAATALAAELAAKLWAEYPGLWPEAVRALMVHSAEWTDRMVEHYLLGKNRLLLPKVLPTLAKYAQSNQRKRRVENLVQHCGWGVPQGPDTLHSRPEAPTVIYQNTLRPFWLDHTRNEVRLKDAHFFDLPLPTERLNGLGETLMELKVTLSYFIQPLPGERGKLVRYRYPSYGLRFDLKQPLETTHAFEKRLNALAIDEEGMRSGSGYNASKGWLLGPMLRHRGSIHCDRWYGTAAELVDRTKLAIYPVVGWWRENREIAQQELTAPYSLMMSIRPVNHKITVDLYSEIQQLIKVGQEIST